MLESGSCTIFNINGVYVAGQVFLMPPPPIPPPTPLINIKISAFCTHNLELKDELGKVRVWVGLG